MRMGEFRGTLCLAIAAALICSATACSSSDSGADGRSTGGGGRLSDAAGDSARDTSAPDSSAPDGRALEAAIPDVVGGHLDAPPRDDAEACVSAPVTVAGLSSFVFTSEGGYSLEPPIDAGCSDDLPLRIEFTAAQGVLSRTGCDSFGRIDRLVHLREAEKSSILAALASLQASCERRMGCGADADNETLVVRQPGSEISYHDDFYSGCSFVTPVMPPFIDYLALGNFFALLQQMIAAACADAGTAPDASRCGLPPIDASDSSTGN
jgi:hypothetical protein